MKAKFKGIDGNGIHRKVMRTPEGWVLRDYGGDSVSLVFIYLTLTI